MPVNWKEYDTGIFFDELVQADGEARPYAKSMVDYIAAQSKEELETRKEIGRAHV